MYRPGEEQTKKYDLAFEAIKIVELMSQLNIEEFQMNQWMFCFDGFGIKHFGPNSPQAEVKLLQIEEEKKELNESGEAPKQVFQPYLAKFMCNAPDGDQGGSGPTSRFVFYNVNENEHLEEETNFNQTLPQETCNFISKDDLLKEMPARAGSRSQVATAPVELQSEKANVQAYATQLQKLFNNRNVKIMKFNLDGANDAIERDFFTKK